jgi:hypothetical protein
VTALASASTSAVTSGGARSSTTSARSFAEVLAGEFTPGTTVIVDRGRGGRARSQRTLAERTALLRTSLALESQE